MNIQINTISFQAQAGHYLLRKNKKNEFVQEINKAHNGVFYDTSYASAFKVNASEAIGNLNKFTLSFKGKHEILGTSKELTQRFCKVISDERNLVGFGNEGKVYKFQNIDYCVKVPHDYSGKVKEGWNFNISPHGKINHIVAESEDGVVVMKYFQGKTIKDVESPDELYSLPNSSYKALLKQISKAKESGMEYDSSPVNVIFNKKDKTLTAIDFFEPTEGIEVWYTPICEVYSTMKTVLSKNFGGDSHKKLINKLLNVALDEFSTGKEPEFILEENDFDRFFMKIRDDFSTNAYNKLPPQFKFLRMSIGDIFDLKKIERRGLDVTNEINAKIKYTRCLVNQIF